jgi:hypothetical protein
VSEPNKTSASLVDPIKTEYREVLRAESNALPHAIECGRLLNLAKEHVKAERSKWKDWREINCSEISQESASLYMRLAEHNDLIEKRKAKSISHANEIVREHNRKQSRGDTQPAKIEQKKSSEQKKKLEDALEALAPDELRKMLVDKWDIEQLRELKKLLDDHLGLVAAAKFAKPEISKGVASSPEVGRRV